MRISKLSCAVIAALATTSAFAQEDAGKAGKAHIETIEVTATKRSESIQDIPVSYTFWCQFAVRHRKIDHQKT